MKYTSQEFPIKKIIIMGLEMGLKSIQWVKLKMAYWGENKILNSCSLIKDYPVSMLKGMDDAVQKIVCDQVIKALPTAHTLGGLIKFAMTFSILQVSNFIA